eukprot:350905-Chlamydomonas_euryale.AAC.1
MAEDQDRFMDRLFSLPGGGKPKPKHKDVRDFLASRPRAAAEAAAEPVAVFQIPASQMSERLHGYMPVELGTVGTAEYGTSLYLFVGCQHLLRWIVLQQRRHRGDVAIFRQHQQRVAILVPQVRRTHLGHHPVLRAHHGDGRVPVGGRVRGRASDAFTISIYAQLMNRSLARDSVSLPSYTSTVR